jgi:hypothetical protein
MEIAERAHDLERLADSIAMGAAGDENHIMAGCRGRPPKYPPTAPSAF